MNRPKSANPRVDVIVPTYNYGHYLGACLRSLHEQTFADFRALIIDNASEDDTREVVEDWLARDGRFEYVRNDSNIGLRNSLNKAYGLTGNELVMILSSDDQLTPRFLETAVAALDRYPECSFAYSGWYLFVDRHGDQNHGLEINVFMPHQESGVYDETVLLLSHNWITNSFTLFRRAVCDAIGGITPAQLHHVGDWFLWESFSAKGPAYYIHEPLGRYRSHANSESDRLMADESSAFDHLYFYDAIFQSRLWSWPVRLLAKANAARWLTGEPLSDIVRKMGGARAEPLMRGLVNKYRDDLYVGAAECILFYTPSKDYLDTVDNGLDLLREVLGRNPGHARARAILDRYQAHRPAAAGGEEAAGPAAGRRQVVVLSVDDTNWACAQIRLLQPLARLSGEFEAVWAVRNENGAYMTNLSLLSGADMVVIQRIYAQQRLKHYLDLVFDLGKPVIYELDDLMFDLPPDNPHYDETLANRDVVFDAIRRADAVTVSCPALAEAVRPYARKVVVLPNLVEADLFRAPVPRPGETVTIGLVGTPTHEKDFAQLDAALEQALAAYPGRLRIVFMGLLPARWAGHPAVIYVPFELDYRAYAGRLKSLGLDIALVPLLDNPFNRAKSNIKWLEFSAAGIAGVFSDLPPYASVRHGVTGLKVANGAEAWLAAIQDLIEHPERRADIARAAQQEVLADWTTAARAVEYAEAWRALLAGRPASPLALAEQGYDGGRFYEIWKQVHEPSLREAEWIAERMHALAQAPVFHLAVIAPPGHEDRLARNLRDLAGQFYRGWRLTVVSAEPAPEGLEELAQVSWIEAPGVHPHLTVNQALAAAGDWVGLVEAGDGLPSQALFRLADAIDRHPDWQVAYSDEDRLLADGRRVEPHFRADFNLDLLRSSPTAVGGLFMLRRALFAQIGGLRPEMDGAETYDLALRALEATDGAAFGHVADVLFHRFEHGGHCPRSADELRAARDTALMEHFGRLGLDVDLGRGLLPDSYRVMYRHPARPRVSVIIPTRNQSALLAQCVDSLLEKTAWPDFEVLIVDNGSDEPAALDYLARIGADARVRVLRYADSFNFSAMNNLAARQATGDYLLLLNNDTAVLHEDWLEEMMSHAQRPEVGIAGARLLFPDGRVQHAGVVLGLGDSPAEHAFSGIDSGDPGYAGRALLAQDYSVVTAACMLVRKSIYEAVEGLDETRFRVAYNDVDFCLKVRQAGWLVVWTPFAMLMHDSGSSQRGSVEAREDADKQARFQAEREAMFSKWRPWIGHDPAYNRNLSFAGRDFKIEISPALTFDADWRPRPRILAHPADRMGCGEYRVIAPMRALNDGGRVMGWETGHYLSEPELFRFEPDSIVMQRQVEWSQIELIERYGRHGKAFRVFELDDLLTNVPVKSSRKKDFVAQKDLHQRFRKAVSLCNRFVVSTDYLAEEYRGYTDEVIAVPNYLERARWGRFKPLRRQGGRLRVGWAGSTTHDGDLLEIMDVVRGTAGEVDWVFFGMCPEELRPLIKEFHPPVPLEDYAAKLASLNLDLAVAPLEDVPFNHGKSHLRLLEYGVLGYPVICTDLTPYRGAYPVTRVPNRYKDWVEAIRAHVADPDELARRGDALRDHIQANWMLEDHLDVWLKAWLP